MEMVDVRVLNAAPTETGEGRKFAADGTPQRFPGNTILCHLPDTACEPIRAAIEDLRSQVERQAFAWLPPASYHVTLFDGALDARRTVVDWPTGLALDASLEDCHALISERLASFDLDFDPPIRFVADESVLSPTLTALPLRPVDSREEARLRALRDRLVTALGLRHANHDSYAFHMSFGYYVRALGPAALLVYRQKLLQTIRRVQREVPVIELGAPEFCLFDDMTAFHARFLLERQR